MTINSENVMEGDDCTSLYDIKLSVNGSFIFTYLTVE